MSKSDKLLDIHGFARVFFIVGTGLGFVSLLEYFGLMSYKPGRQPLGAATWLIMGGFCFVIGIIIRKLSSS